mgnify:FL=1
MPLPRLKPEAAFLVNQIDTKGKIPEWATEKIIQKTKKESYKILDKYLAQRSFDLYLATSLRELDDFTKAEKFASHIEQNLNISVVYTGGLGVTKETPEYDAAEAKGDMERLFLERSQSLLMIAADKFTVGKYFEAATMALSGKPVVILFDDENQANIIKVRHPLKTLGAVEESYGFHALVNNQDDPLQCLKAELGLDEHFGNDFRLMLNENHTDRRRNCYCPYCKSLIIRRPFWLKAHND